MEKVYKVTFIEYTNALKNCVANGKEGKDRKYLSLPHNSSLVVKETELHTLWEYGQGFRTVEYVGDLYGTVAPEYLATKQ